jgi:glycosyltransferase involved in cell wall biosynthesis
MKRRILIPRNSFGWSGGNQYYEIIVRGLLELERRGNIKTISIPLPKKKLFLKADKLITKYERLTSILLGLFFVNIVRPSSPFAPRALVWIPDFQELDLPENFDLEEINSRRLIIKQNTKNHRRIYLSRNSALKVFEENFSEFNKSAGVIRFNSSLGEQPRDKEALDFCKGCSEIGYFYAPNQFWLHKNHHLLISAFDSYRSSGGEKHLVLTGSNSDYRDTDYGKNLESRITTTKNVHYLGVVKRSFQINLFENASLLIQPSLYEGWSVSIEEGISFGLPIIASDISVNREQLAEYPNSTFFEKNSVGSLRGLLHRSYSVLPAEQKLIINQNRNNRYLRDLQETIHLYYESLNRNKKNA